MEEAIGARERLVAATRRWLAGCGAVVGVVGSCVVVAGPAFGAADIERLTSSAAVGPDLVDDTCAGAGVVGVLTGTETIDGRFVTTSTGRHFTGTDALVYRVDFPDGSYLSASQRSPLSFTGTQLDRVVTFGSTLHERGTLYDANGNILGYEQFHARNRTTIVDASSRTLTEDSSPAGDAPAIENHNSTPQANNAATPRRTARDMPSHP